MRLYEEDYKGKFDILTDSPENSYWECPNDPVDIDIETFDWQSHVRQANYYGVPAYIGENKEINKIIKKIELQILDECDYCFMNPCGCP